MNDKPLPYPVTLSLGGETIEIATVQTAYDLLITRWPEEQRGDRHRDAVDTCLKVLDGHRSAIDAEQALREAADEAGIAIG